MHMANPDSVLESHKVGSLISARNDLKYWWVWSRHEISPQSLYLVYNMCSINIYQLSTNIFCGGKYRLEIYILVASEIIHCIFSHYLYFEHSS